MTMRACGLVDKVPRLRIKRCGVQWPLLVICRCVGKLLISCCLCSVFTQQWWVPGGTKQSQIVMNGSRCRKWAPQRRWERKRMCFNTKSVNCTFLWIHGNIWTVNMYIYIYILVFLWITHTLSLNSLEFCWITKKTSGQTASQEHALYL